MTETVAQEIPSPMEDNTVYPFVLKFLAKIFSYLFHPLFIPVYFTFFLVYMHPSAFIGFSSTEKIKTVVIVALNVSFFPLICVLLLKAVGFVDSLYLHTRKDRIIPYIASGVFFFWAYTVFKEQPQYPSVLSAFIFGIFLASSAALIANIYFKISMHAIGMGGWLGVFLLLFYNDAMMMGGPLVTVLLLTGIVMTSRLILKAHHAFDIYTGFFLGLICQWTAYYFVG